MLVRRAPEVSRQDTQDAAPPAPSLRRKRLTSVLRASWHIFRNRRLASSHRPPEMHALDHLAKHHTKVFV
jgi:hypothetical protein